MRSALLCVFFTLITLRRIQAQYDDFRPTPIPLSEWRHDRREGRSGTFHEAFKTESLPKIAPHYWEDALRHSVYLTLVRDKIDQLIAKGEVISPNSKPGGYDSKEIDDHDLWEKIKTAPFDRIQQEEPGVFGDVTIMAKGRLLENDKGFHFIEDVRSKEKCKDDDCVRDVKAFWSVKRVKQRDADTSPGKHNYELTFSVISHIPKKQRKPYENSIRTFTVKESTPNGLSDRPQENRKESSAKGVLDKPQEYRKFHGPPQTPRPERAIWIHKNISPAKQTGRKHYYHGLDRIFSSLFSDDEEKPYDTPLQKYKQNAYITPVSSQYSKIGYAASPIEQNQQIPYPYRPHPAKHIRPPLQVPPIHPIQHPYLDMGIITAPNNIPYAPHSYDHREESSQTVKTTRPAVLPTPLPHNSQSSEVTNVMSVESVDNTSLAPETTVIHKTYNKYKTTPAKINYFTDHVRPPIYNAPPGVFVTMDKKPFKPMPPLKLMHSTKHHRPNRPIDFRPSPQITETQSTDPFADSAFRPITMNFDNIIPEKFETVETTKKDEQHKIRKPTAASKKPLKKYEKPPRTTTATPEIITAQSTSAEEIDTMDWANILGAFTKTTPMISQTEKVYIPEATTPMTTTTAATTTRSRSTTTNETQQPSTTTTTAKPKRTRPPPKFVKQDRIKKHKRLTTTSTSTTTTTSTTTEAPTTTIKKRIVYDLTPQASSAATGVPKTTKSYREPYNNTQTTTTSTTSTTTTTTIRPSTEKTTTTTTTTQSPPLTVKSIASTTQSRNKNRFRQSTLMVKGTSIKHDKWNGIQYNQTVTPTPPSAVHTYRRKGSNFHGYVTPSTTRQTVEQRERNHPDHIPSLNVEPVTVRTTSQTNASYDETFEQYETNSVIPLEPTDKESDEDYEDGSKDHTEFIFQPTTTQASVQIISSSYSPAVNKTKCKKKKNSVTTQEPDLSIETFGTTPKSNINTTTRMPTEAPTTTDILEEFLNFNFNDDGDDEKDPFHSRVDSQKEESLNNESFLKIDDFEEFLDMHLSDKKKLSDDDQYGDDDDENGDDDEYENSKIPSIDDDTDFELNSEGREGRENTGGHSDSEGTNVKRPYTLLELMAMT